MFEEQVMFEIAALFRPPIRRMKKRDKFKSYLFFNQMVSFLYCLCSKEKKNMKRSVINDLVYESIFLSKRSRSAIYYFLSFCLCAWKQFQSSRSRPWLWYFLTFDFYFLLLLPKHVNFFRETDWRIGLSIVL